MKVKVLMLIINMIPEDGVCSFAMNYLRKMQNKDGIVIDFVVYKDCNSLLKNEVESLGSNVYVLPPLKHYREHKKACKKILKNNYDIIHDNSLIRTLPMLKLAKESRCKVRILHSHNSKLSESKVKMLINRILLKKLFKNITHFVACSDYAGKELFGDNKFDFLPNIVDGDRFEYKSLMRNKIRSKYDCENTFIIGTVGRIASQKNPLFALEVIKKLNKKTKNFEYWWIGDGSMKDEAIDFVKRNNLEKRVKFLGSQKEVENYYSALDLFMLPSYFEGLPVSIVEAQANGLPCIISDTITKQTKFTDLVMYLPIDDSEIWAREIYERVNTPKFDRSKSEKYHEIFKSSIFSDENATQNLRELYMKYLDM